jgi:arylsulfatase A-like enzyme
MKPLVALAVLAGSAAAAGAPQRSLTPDRNVIIFVADGLRYGSVTKDDAPALWAVRTEGVNFENSHSLFPTFTTANASAIATGHHLGDTGDYSNTIWTGFATFDTGNFGLDAGTPVPFIENDRILADLADHFGGNYLGEPSLMAIARANGYRTAVVGKTGPVAIQDVRAIAPEGGAFPSVVETVMVDDATGSAAGVPVPLLLIGDLQLAGLPFEAPTRTNGYGATSVYNNGYSGDRTHAGTRAANVVQQQWFADAATSRILPWLAGDDRPFALVYWSRDPDGSQHNQGDSLNTLWPGINGDTSRQALRNADRNLQQILDWLDAHPALKASTNVVVTSDHGFSTISRREIDRSGAATTAESANHEYLTATGQIDTPLGTLPTGFLAVDLAYALHTDLYDPDQHVEGNRPFKRLRIEPNTMAWEHPANGNGVISFVPPKPDASDARVIVAANGGSDLVYVPDGNAETVRRLVDVLTTFDYIGGLFVDDKYGAIAGTLPLSAINLAGASKLPRPAIVVAFKGFYSNDANLHTSVQLSDTALQEGQGMHGGFGREQTFNNMAAIGPDFKARFTDRAPVGNADIAPTLLKIMNLTAASVGSLKGRVIAEALAEGPDAPSPERRVDRSKEVNGRITLLEYQVYDGLRYLDAACFVGSSQGICREGKKP